jgi:hypothetical protein
MKYRKVNSSTKKREGWVPRALRRYRFSAPFVALHKFFKSVGTFVALLSFSLKGLQLSSFKQSFIRIEFVSLKVGEI